jgi:hypothetical protein
MLAAAKEKRWPDLAAMMDVPDDARGGLAALLQMSEKQERLDAAFKSKFGKTMLEAMSSNPMVAEAMKNRGFDPASIAKLSPSDLQATSNGDSGTVTAGGASLSFKKVNGKWLYSDQMLQMAGMMGGMAPALGKAMDDLAGEIEAGKYPDATAAVAALTAKMQAAMMGGGPPGAPKKGPGGG